MGAEVHQFPREGFVIGAGHCGAPGPEKHLICLAPAGHADEHQWRDWRGCRVRVPDFGLIPFHGFVG